MTASAARKSLPATLILGMVAMLAALAPSEAAADARPATAKCGKLKAKAQKSRCLKENKANRIAFNQIKDSRFVGARGDGEEIDAVFCANGKFEDRSTGSYGTGISTGRHWEIDDAVVRRHGKWIDAFLQGPEGFEIALQRRGKQWLIGIASLGRILEPGAMEKTNAAADCRALAV
jgi:hypothetical protein